MKSLSASSIAFLALVSTSVCQISPAEPQLTIDEILSYTDLPVPDFADYVYDHDDRLIIGGRKTSKSRNLVRIGAGNRIENSFPETNGTVMDVAVTRDGSIYIAGQFTEIGGIAQSYLARLSPDGKVDPDFRPVFNGQVHKVTFAPDGDLFVAGLFSEVNATPKEVIAKMHVDGTLATWTNQQTSNDISIVYPLSDGKLLISGPTRGFYNSFYLNRLDLTGALDTSFATPTVNQGIDALCELSDGRIHAAGVFQKFVALLSNSGVRDESFDPGFTGPGDSTDGGRASITVLSDNTRLVSGTMNSTQGNPWAGLVSLQPDGSPIHGITLKDFALHRPPAIGENGRCVFPGYYRTSSENISGLMGLSLGEAVSSLAVEENFLKWKRSGSIPALRNVRFEFLPASGANWLALGDVGFQTGSWQIPISSVTGNGVVRASGERLSAPNISYAAAYMNFGNASADLAAYNTTGEPFLAGDTHAFSETLTSATSEPFRIEIRNNGSGTAFDLTPVISGPGADHFKIRQLPVSTLPPGQASSIEIVFAPITPGAKQATFNLSGLGITISLSGAGSNVIKFDLRTEPIPLVTETGFDFSDKVIGRLDLPWEPLVGSSYTVIRAAENMVPLANLPQGGYFNAYFGETEYRFQADYRNSSGLTGKELKIRFAGRGSVDIRSEFRANPYGAQAIAPLVGERMAVGGTFTSFSSAGTYTASKYLAYPETAVPYDGILSPLPNDSVRAFLVYDNGSHLIAGSFTEIGGTPSPYLARMTPDLKLDTTFTPEINGSVSNMLLLPDGRILILGAFTEIGGQPAPGIAIISPNGTLDPSFVPPAFEAGSMVSIYRDQEGKFLVGGSMTDAGGTAVDSLVRLLADGSLDSTFNVSFDGAGRYVSSVHVQQDGKIVVGGSFTAVNGLARTGLARLTPSGETDPSFVPNPYGTVSSAAPSMDGNIILSKRSDPGIQSVGSDGNLDPSFRAKVSGTVSKIILGSDGRIHAVGRFQSTDSSSSFLGYSTFHNSPATSVVEKTGDTYTWLPGGSHPLPSYARYEIATVGQTGWQDFGPVLESGSGYTLSDTGLPQAGVIRCKSRISTQQSDYPAFSEGIPFGPETAQIAASPASATPVVFGNTPVGLSRETTITLNSVGNIPLDGLAASMSGVNSADFTVTFTKNSLPSISGDFLPQTSETLHILFSPSAPGAKQGTVTLSSPSLATPLIISLNGNAASHFSPTFPLTESSPPFASTSDISPVSLSTVTLTERPTPGITYTGFANRSGTPFTNARAALRQGAFFDAAFGGENFKFIISHIGGNTGDLTFTLVNPGTVDLTKNTTSNNAVYAIAALPGGKTLIGGNFTSINGEERNRIARLNPDGTLDPTFNPLLSLDSRPESFHPFPDGRVLVAGSFTTVNSFSRQALVMIDVNGDVDPSFDARINSGAVTRILELSDGNLLLGGTFLGLNGSGGVRIGKIDLTGQEVPGFTPPQLAAVPNTDPYDIYALAELDDGKILIGSSFSYAGTPYTYRNNLIRLDPDGTFDPTLDLKIGPSTGDKSRVSAILEGPDGKIYLGGHFRSLDGRPFHSICRLEQIDGELVVDADYNPSFDDGVTCLSFQSDGKLLVTGSFESLNGSEQVGMSRLLPDGTPDTEFHPMFNGPVKATSVYGRNSVIAEDGSIITAGQPYGANGLSTPFLVRLLNGPTSASLSIEGENLIWQRSGTSPALKNVTFETTPDQGLTWIPTSPAPLRVGNGWSVPATSLPPHGHLRIRGRNLMPARSAGYLDKIEIYGRASTPAELWRLQYFNTPFNQGNAADNHEAFQDGAPNLLLRAFGIPPLSTGSPQLPAWNLTSEGYLTSFTRPPFTEDIEYRMQWSENLAPDHWHETEPTETEGIIKYSIPYSETGRMFFRHKITPSE